MVRKLVASGKQLIFVYEAGPCGFAIYRWLPNAGSTMLGGVALAHAEEAERADQDRSARLPETGAARPRQSPIHVPDQRDEAVRDLVRAREVSSADDLRLSGN